jgi:hypothetical protein
VHPRLDLIHGLNINTPGGDGYSQLGFTASGSDTLRYCEDLLAMLIAERAAEEIVVEVVRRFWGIRPKRSGAGDEVDARSGTQPRLWRDPTATLPQ